MIQIKETNPPLVQKRLVALEARMGATIPEPYRAFLMTHNGGRPKPDLVDIDDAPFEGADIQVFFGIGTTHETSEISWRLEAYRGCLENKLLPIACDSYGNIFTIPLTGEQRGSVYYFRWWHLGRPVDPPEPWLVAPDFQSFLDKIRDWTPEELAEFDNIEPQAYRAVDMTKTGRKLTDADITRIEETIGLHLPEPYRTYLTMFNGGFPNPNVVDIDGAPFTGTVLYELFSFDTADGVCDMLWYWESVADCKEKKWFPIGRDAGDDSEVPDNYFMLDLTAERYGQVYYFDAQEDPPHPYFVAKDFDALIDKLRYLTPEELGEPEPIEVSIRRDPPSDESSESALRRFSGSRPSDEAHANAAAGHDATPRGYVWHRHQDGETLQLVPKDVHKQTGDPQGYSIRWRPS
ncbi:MAG: SMI1/KNR4 family protein [Polyangiaceae bacterium]|nr:SMI1/KNR4 family protein [Polyangiaceae bacterium]